MVTPLFDRIRHSADTHPAIWRWVLAGPAGLVAAAATIMAMPLWLPAGPAGLDNIVFPLIFTPLIWAAIFVYACLDDKLWRLAVVIICSTAIQGIAVAAALAGYI